MSRPEGGARTGEVKRGGAGLVAVARALGVSPSTVSNAYNRPDQLSAALRERVLSKAAELGYAGPHPLARGLRTGRAGAVGVVFHDRVAYAFDDPAAVLFLQGFTGATDAEGLAAAGEGHGIRVNLLLPAATTRMVTDPDFRVKANLPPLPAGDEPDPRRGPEQIAPMLLVLAHETCPVNGEMLEAAFGRFARAYLAETRGIVEPGITPEALLARWDEVVDDAGRATPGSTREAIAFREAVLRQTTPA